MRQAFVNQKFRGTTLDVIDRANQICADYSAQGFNLTLRQVYYQFVARDWIRNHQREYKRLGDILNNARLAGYMDWSYIQDRTRNVSGNFSGFGDPGQFIDQIKDQYYEALWEGQDYRPEVWVEKDALVDIVEQACAPRRVPYFSCRGYGSQSEMYDAAQRMRRRYRAGLQPVVIHLGDHDPSGVDMTRDIRDRLSMMAGFSVRVDRIALTMDQIDQYSPPPNFAKITDSRANGYIDEFGTDSWELDALEPQVLTDLIQETVDRLVNEDEWDGRVEVEQSNADRLREIADRWGDLEDRWDDVLALLGD